MTQSLWEQGDFQALYSSFLRDLPHGSFPFRESMLGFSREERPIPLLQMGDGPHCKLLLSGVEGSHWPAVLLLLAFCRQLLQAVENAQPLGDVQVERVLESRSLWVLPCLNPDGFARCSPGAAPWKGNAKGVRLGHNFPGQWSLSRGAQGASCGPFPLSEPESQVLYRLCQHPFRQCFVFSWGEGRIRCGVGERPLPQGELIGQMLAHSGPYPLSKGVGSSSLADWFCRSFRQPAFLLSLAGGSEPPTQEELQDLFQELLELFLMILLV